MHVVVDEGLPGSEPPGRPFGFSGEREGFGGGFPSNDGRGVSVRKE
jgi:hypothetical protein